MHISRGAPTYDLAQRLSYACTLFRRKELALKASEKRKTEQLGIDPADLLDTPPGDEQQGS